MFRQKYIHLYTSTILFFIAVSLVTSSPFNIIVKREIEVIVEVVTCTVTVTAYEVPSSSAIDENLTNQVILPLQDSDAVQDSQDFLKFNESGKDVTSLASLTNGNVSNDMESSTPQDGTLKNFILDSSATPESSDNQDAANSSKFIADSEPLAIDDFSKVPEPPAFNEVSKQQEAPAFINVPKVPEPPAFNEALKQQEAPAFINVPKVPEPPAFNEVSKVPEVSATPKSAIKNESPNNEKIVPVALNNGKDQDSGSSKVDPPQDISNLQDTPKDQDREITSDSTPEKKKTESSPKALSDYEATTIERHNAHRSNHSSIELTWNKTLASFALETAKTCVFAHDLTPGDGKYGQNIAAFGSSKGVKSLDKSTLIADAVSNKWYNSEFKFVPFGIPRPSTSGPEFLHLTQIIWKETKSVGCVTFECPSGSIFSTPSQYTVCNYFPAGNIMGKFDEQISRPLGQKTIIATIA